MALNDDDITTNTGGGLEGPADGGATPGHQDGGADGGAEGPADGGASPGQQDGGADGGAEGRDGGRLAGTNRVPFAACVALARWST
ncbi:hypothetical protein ABT336_18810, partial [Micromonospora sp. NPDC000207]|uniref:hypothetical protein n=1 Tax=Micromonospora sp. NPDC000207 TaxID=3154246 RepID=UPI003316BE57